MFLSVIAPRYFVGGARDVQFVGRKVYRKNRARCTDKHDDLREKPIKQTPTLIIVRMLSFIVDDLFTEEGIESEEFY